MEQKKCKSCNGSGFISLGEGIKEIKVCPYCKGKGIEETNIEEFKTETDIYADQEQTFLETFAVVKEKIDAGIPMLTAKEEFIDSIIQDWAELWGYETVK